MNLPHTDAPQIALQIFIVASQHPPSVHGGLAAVTVRTDQDGVVLSTTENSAYHRGETAPRLEMIAAIAALDALGSCTSEPIVLLAGSNLIPNAMTIHLPKWKVQGWIKKDLSPVANRDLVERLEAAAKGRNIEWRMAKDATYQGHHLRAKQIALASANSGKYRHD